MMISKIILNIPLKKILKLLDNKYKYEIIYNLTLNKMRFGELKENIATITQQLLTKQLKRLVQTLLWTLGQMVLPSRKRKKT